MMKSLIPHWVKWLFKNFWNEVLCTLHLYEVKILFHEMWRVIFCYQFPNHSPFLEKELILTSVDPI